MSLSPQAQGAQSPETEVDISSIKLKLENTFATMQDGLKSSNMKVYARVRPMLQREEDAGYRESIGVVDDQVVRAVVPTSSVKFKNLSQNGQEIYEDFTYSQAFGPETGQFEFFRKTIMDIMQGFIEGQNCLIFSYGITNSGKTFTLQGDEANPGIIPLAMRLFFASIKHQLMDGISVKPDKFADILMLNDRESVSETQLKDQLIQLSEQESANKSNSSANLPKSFASTLCDCFNEEFVYETETTLPPEEMMAAQSALYMKDLSKQSADQQEGLCSIWVSFVEIYNEYIYDLLQPNILTRAKLMLAEDHNGDVYVKGAREICVSSGDEALKLLSLGRRNLRIASTKLNYQSSRSHCIFTVKVVRLYDEENGRVNRISFCDLAGSERAAKSQTTGVQLKEAGYINTSILVLGKCLDQLRLNQTSKDKKMIPLRESKLTRLFSGHFQGKGKAVMIANASPCEYTFDETLNVLRFSALLKTLKLNDSYISAASNSLQNITNQWSKSRARVSDVSLDQSADLDNSLLEDIQEKDEMIEKLLDIADSLRSNLEKEKTEKAELEIKIRKDVCREYSENSDQMIENQKRIAADYIDSLKEIHNKRVADLVEMYEKRISDLRSQLEECDSCTDESYMSINKSNATLEIEDAENSKILFASPVPVVKTEIQSYKESPLNVKAPPETLPVKSESFDVEQIKSLQTDLILVTEQLEITKEQLQLSSDKLKEAETEAAIAKEECDSLSNKLSKAEVMCLQYTKDIDSFKSESLKKNNETESLKKEKKNLEENILFLSEEIALATAEIEKLKKDKTDAEKNYAEQSNLSQQILAQADEQCKQLSEKLDASNKSISEGIAKIGELESKCLSDLDNKTQLEEQNMDLLDNYSSVLEQLATTNMDLQCIKIAKLEAEESYSQQSMEEQKKISSITEECEDLRLKLDKASADWNVANSKYEKLEFEYENFRNHNSKLLADYKTLEEKLEQLTRLQMNAADRCKELELELEKTAKVIEHERTVAIERKSICDSHKIENVKLIEDLKALKENMASESKQSGSEAEVKCQELSEQLEDVNKTIQDQAIKIKQLEEECAILKSANSELSANYESNKQEYAILLEQGNEKADLKCHELNKQLEDVNKVIKDQETKISKLEEDCAVLSCENAELSTNYNMEKDKCAVFLEEQAAASSGIKSLQKELTVAMDVNLKTINDLKLELAVAQEKYNELVTKIEEQNAKISRLELDCSTYKTNNEQLLEVQKKLEEECVTLSEKHDLAVAQEKCSEFISKLEEQNSKISELETECAKFKTDNEELLEAKKKLEEECAGLTLIKLEEQNSKISELELDCDKFKTDNEELLEAKKRLEEDCASLTEKYDLAIAQEKCSEFISKLEVQNSKILELETDCAKFKTDNEELLEAKKKLEECADLTLIKLDKQNSKISELELDCATFKTDNEELLEAKQKLEENCASLVEKYGVKEDLLDLKSQINRLQTECDQHKSNYDKVYENYQVLDTAFDALSKEIGPLRTDFDQLKQEKLNQADANAKTVKELQDGCEISKKEIDELGVKLEEAQTKKTSYEKEIMQLTSDCTVFKEKCAELEAENSELKAQLKEVPTANLEAMKKYTEKIAELEKIISSNEAKAKDLTESIQTLEKYKANFQDCEKENNTQKEEIACLKEELEESKLLQEQSDLLCLSLQKCELHATNKIKLLDSLHLKCVEEITDMRRQIKEKNRSMEELEKALCDSQKQIKEMDAKITKQVAAKRQDSARMEQLLHQKKLLETEVTKLKMDVQQAKIQLQEANEKAVETIASNETLEDNNQSANEAKRSSNTSKGRKKRSLSDMNKETDENSVDKENTKSTSSLNKVLEKKKSASKVNKKENIDENEALPKRRRVLKPKQVVIESADDSSEIEENDEEEYEPKKKVIVRKKKTASNKVEPPKQVEPPKLRTSRKKLVQDQENMSPVKKAMQYMGSKIRSVAQSVSSMPSPRVTRGRKKLFNADAAPKVESKWKL